MRSFWLSTARQVAEGVDRYGIADPGYVARLYRDAPIVLRYLVRGLMENTPAAARTFDELVDLSVGYLHGSSDVPSRDRAAVLVAMKLGTLVLAAHLSAISTRAPLCWLYPAQRCGHARHPESAPGGPTSWLPLARPPAQTKRPDRDLSREDPTTQQAIRKGHRARWSRPGRGGRGRSRFPRPQWRWQDHHLRILLGMLRSDSGTASVLGMDPLRDVVALHSRLAYVPGDVTLWPNLTGGEVIDVLAKLHGGGSSRGPWLERFELDPTKKCRTYSKGNRQKVALVAAFAADAELLILDEPTSGLETAHGAGLRRRDP